MIKWPLFHAYTKIYSVVANSLQLRRCFCRRTSWKRGIMNQSTVVNETFHSLHNFHVKNQDTLVQCISCRQYLDCKHFVVTHRNTISVKKRCSSCRDRATKKMHERRSTLKGFCSHLCAKSRSRSKSRKENQRNMIGSHEISPESLMLLYEKQNGLGYLSKMPMSHQPLSDWQMSPDRLNDNEDYTIQNTVLEALEFNHVTKWTEDKMEQIPQLLQSAVSYTDLKHEVDDARSKEKRTIRYKAEKFVANDAVYYKCFCCNLYKMYNEFYASVTTRCKQCALQRNEERMQTMRGFVNSLIAHTRQASETDSNDQIDKQFVLDLILYQQGRGFYTGLPLSFKKGTHWQCSIERKDNSVAYTRDNVVLEAWEFNTMDQSVIARNINAVTGSGQWNRDKVCLFYATKFNEDLHKSLPDFKHWQDL